jgi:hypothetical protein
MALRAEKTFSSMSLRLKRAAAGALALATLINSIDVLQEGRQVAGGWPFTRGSKAISSVALCGRESVGGWNWVHHGVILSRGLECCWCIGWYCTVGFTEAI